MTPGIWDKYSESHTKPAGADKTGRVNLAAWREVHSRAVIIYVNLKFWEWEK